MLFQLRTGKRPKKEVDYLMKLPEEFLGTFLPELIEENVQVRVIGAKRSSSYAYTQSDGESHGRYEREYGINS